MDTSEDKPVRKSLQELVDEWLALDQDPETRAEIIQLAQKKDDSELERRLRGYITFGTAGLRARMEAGFTRMNSLTVIQASQGLASYMLAQDPHAKTKGVVIGRDARYNSEKFAGLAAAAFTSKDIKVYWLDSVHTPLVPFAVNLFSAAAGIMVTASHNPARDNGYKVYWSNGCQIIPPHDIGIAGQISRYAKPVSWDFEVWKHENRLVSHVREAVEDAYYEKVKNAVAADTRTPIPPFVYTPMHGVGLRPMQAVLRLLASAEDIKRVAIVAEQADPDPEFPTVRFPNPEEKGALDCAMRLADVRGIPLIVATDPDADRLAVAEKLSGEQWHQFTGNQLGILLAASVLENLPTDRSRYAMLNSTVSSGMLSQMAKQEGFEFVETLTGFKWLGNVAQQLSAEKGYIVPFAFEEALGYMFTGIAHDKDGISATAFFLAAAAKWRDLEKLTPFEKLQQLYGKYGYFADANTYLVSPSPDVTDSVFASIRSLSRTSTGVEGSPYPSHLGSRKILTWRDLTTGYDSQTPDHVPLLPTDEKSQMITCVIEGQTRFTIRGSGTEPKIKLYVETRASSMHAAVITARSVQADLVREWFKPEEYKLRLA